LNGIKIERTKLKAAALGDTQNKRGSESSEGFPRIGGFIASESEMFGLSIGG